MTHHAQPSGLVFNIQRFSIHDGPGTRTLVFLKGCPLRCLWCSNPEGLATYPEILLRAEACTGCGRCVAACPAGVHRPGPDSAPAHGVDRMARCLGCGTCVAACPAQALTLAGRTMTAAEVVEEVLRDSPFYWSSGGGVTLSGGEACAQPAFARAILAGCREGGLHTTVETCGMVPWAALAAVAEATDLFLFDLKHVDDARHRALTGASNRQILANLARLLERSQPLTVRMPLIPGRNDDPASLERAFRFLAASGAAASGREVHLLPFHRYGESKYPRLDLPLPPTPIREHSPEELESILRLAAACGVAARILGH